MANGYVTFGSCNNLGKLTDSVLELWGKLLHELPTARLLIEGKNLEKAEFCDSYRARCECLGIPPERLILVPLDQGSQYLTYHRIDIALDPFPLTGGTTSFDLLWMGVPLVSMDGNCFKSRMGTGILTYLGRSEWLATNRNQYVEIAKQLASSFQRLDAIRQSLRREVEQSVLMREDLFRRHFAEGLRTMWLRELAKSLSHGDPVTASLMTEEWLTSRPAEWAMPPDPGVGIATGQRLSLQQAYQRLQLLVDKAKVVAPLQKHANDGMIKDKHWIELTEFAETVLSAVPNDPVALTCLAEVELAHGHAEFAVTYLEHAQEALASRGKLDPLGT
jgi:hypothetical protein